ncbi:MAG: hypothetical protein CL571_01730 [Alphaproteobacteria bacterium]|nr:hypothetical protein [Alphaproteobacteria bacterium]
MSNEKKIEDLIYSISSLIKEAEQESKLLLEIENKIESFDLKKENMLNNKKIGFSDDKKIDDKKIKDSQPAEKSKFHDWRLLSFVKEKHNEELRVNFEQRFSKVFESEINNWMKSNFKDLVQAELNKFSSRIIAEKLK